MIGGFIDQRKVFSSMNSSASKTLVCSPPDNVLKWTPEDIWIQLKQNLTLARSAIAQIHTDLVMYHRLVVADLPLVEESKRMLADG